MNNPLQQILHFWQNGRPSHPKVAGVEIFHSEEGRYCFHVVVAALNGEEINLIAQEANIGSIEMLRSKLAPYEVPVFLVCSTRSIIHKFISKPEGDKFQDFMAIMPDADPDQFYIQEEPVAGGKIISLIRKETFYELQEDFQAPGLWVIGSALGSFSARRFGAFFPAEFALDTQTQTLRFSQNELAGFERRQHPPIQEITIGQDRLPGVLLVAYGAAVREILGEGSALDSPVLQEKRGEYFHYLLFNKAKWIVLGSLLCILLTNTLFYYKYKDANDVYAQKISAMSIQLQHLDSLKGLLAEQKNLLQKTNFNQASRTSFYADRIAASVPQGITLTLIQVFPLKGREEDYTAGDLPVYQNGQVRIKGFCNSSTVYNDWLEYLNRQAWVNGIKHLNYSDISLEKGAFEFLIIAGSSEKPAVGPGN